METKWKQLRIIVILCGGTRGGFMNNDQVTSETNELDIVRSEMTKIAEDERTGVNGVQIGEQLLDLGLISAQELKEAHSICRATGYELGEILLLTGVITAGQLTYVKQRHEAAGVPA